MAKSLTGSGVDYTLVGFVGGNIVRPDSTQPTGVKITSAPEVAQQLSKLGISNLGGVQLQYKLDGGKLHWQWRGPSKNRDYGAAFDTINVFASAGTVAAPKSPCGGYVKAEDHDADTSQFLDEDELAF